jgi:hypothetical protein
MVKSTVHQTAAVRATRDLAKAQGKVDNAQSVLLRSFVDVLANDVLDRNARIKLINACADEYVKHRPTCTLDSAKRILRDLWQAAEKGITDASKTPRQVAKNNPAAKAKAAKGANDLTKKKGGASGAETATPETHSQGHEADDWNKNTHRRETAKGAREQAIALQALLVPGATVTNEMKQLVSSLVSRLKIVVEGF